MTNPLRSGYSIWTKHRIHIYGAVKEWIRNSCVELSEDQKRKIIKSTEKSNPSILSLENLKKEKGKGLSLLQTGISLTFYQKKRNLLWVL